MIDASAAAKRSLEVTAGNYYARSGAVRARGVGDHARRRAITKGPAKVEVTAGIDGKAAAVHVYEDNGQLKCWLSALLSSKRPYVGSGTCRATRAARCS
ncbi:MAG: hypothetical protein NT062_36980 [Proteobacteria bacterium]|nr:hypothetical protein [Pseudomonadota bacterium]